MIYNIQHLYTTNKTIFYVKIPNWIPKDKTAVLYQNQCWRYGPCFPWLLALGSGFLLKGPNFGSWLGSSLYKFPYQLRILLWLPLKWSGSRLHAPSSWELFLLATATAPSKTALLPAPGIGLTNFIYKLLLQFSSL